MSHRLLSAAAARLGVGASTTTIASTTPLVTPPAAPAAAAPAPAPAPAAQSEGDAVDVVTVADAQAAVAAAETRGATAERERTNAVFASDEGKANPQMAAFMLNSNPGAPADAIVAHLKTMPAAAAPSTAPAATTTAAPQPPAMTHDLNNTPKVTVGVEANQDGAEGIAAADADKFWQGATAAAATANSPFGGELAPGLPRTGN